MIKFDPQDLFPLYSLDAYTYSEAQAHAAWVDQELGFEISAVEKKIRKENKCEDQQQNWQHLSPQAFQTPYVELRNIVELLELQPEDHLVDLGCAYGRMGFVIGCHKSQARFTGFELEELRVIEAKRVLLKRGFRNVHFVQGDLSSVSFVIPLANVYFIFDYGSAEAVQKTLEDLRKLAQTQQIKVVARGKLVRFWIHKEHPWLAEVNQAQHFAHFSIYRS